MSKKIKILYIIDCFENPYAGTEGQLVKLVSGLDKKAFTPHLLILRNTFYMKEPYVPFAADVLNINGLSSVSSWISLYQYLKQKKLEGFTIGHTYFFDASLICPPILKVLGYKILISRRDMGYWYTAKKLAVLKINSFYVDGVVANSEAVKVVTMQKEGYSSAQVKVIYNGCIDNENSDSHEPELDTNQLNIVLVANLRPIKRIEDAIRAMKYVVKTAKAKLYIIGDGDDVKLKQLCMDLNIEHVVNFLGPRKNVFTLLPRFDIGILCSESEGFSNALIEYMQNSLPVVCSNVGGNPEIVEHCVNGYLYDVGDIQMLAKYILELVSDEKLRDQMGRSGREKVKENYSLTSYVVSHQKLYENLF